MIYAITSSKDTTLYESSSTQNTGLDEILQIEKQPSNDSPLEYCNSRFLIKFDLDKIQTDITAGSITDPTFDLHIYETEAQEVPIAYTIYGYPVSESWEMGRGKYNDFPVTTVGASWTYKDYYPSGSNWALSGSSYISSSVVSQSYNYQSGDININISTIVNQWLSSSISNYGLVFKRSDTDEASTARLGTLSFYSKETNTIYQPRLYVKWDDSSWDVREAYYTSHSLQYKESTYIASGTLSDNPEYDFISGSTVYQYYPAMSELTAENIEVFPIRLKQQYKKSSRVRFRIQGREKYITKRFNRSFHSSSVEYLPTSSYYSVVDTMANEVIIPFDTTYTKMSLDSTGNYFDLWMDQFESGRYYKFLYKIIKDSNVEVFDNNYIFKVVK